MKRILQRMLKKINYTTHSSLVDGSYQPIPKDMDEEFKDIYNKCRYYTMTSMERMYALYKSVEYIINAEIPGDFVECGVWKGGSSMIMAHTLQKIGDLSRNIYLYDTFEGMVKPTEKDIKISDSMPAIEKWEKIGRDSNKWAFSSIEDVRKNMMSTGYPLDKFIFVKGRIEETIPGKVPQRISILRLDTDWYESTYHELKHLFPLLSAEGVLVIDDYGYWAGAKEAVDKYFNENKIKIFLCRIDNTGRIGIK